MAMVMAMEGERGIPYRRAQVKRTYRRWYRNYIFPCIIDGARRWNEPVSERWKQPGRFKKYSACSCWMCSGYNKFYSEKRAFYRAMDRYESAKWE